MSWRDEEEFEGRWVGPLIELTPPAWVVAFVVCVLVVDSCRSRMDILDLQERVEAVEGGEP